MAARSVDVPAQSRTLTLAGVDRAATVPGVDWPDNPASNWLVRIAGALLGFGPVSNAPLSGSPMLGFPLTAPPGRTAIVFFGSRILAVDPTNILLLEPLPKMGE